MNYLLIIKYTRVAVVFRAILLVVTEKKFFITDMFVVRGVSIFSNTCCFDDI